MVLGQVLMAQRVFLDVVKVEEAEVRGPLVVQAVRVCLLYTSDAADE